MRNSVAFLLVLFLCVNELPGAEQEGSVLESLRLQWRTQKTEIFNARIRYRLFQRSGLLPLSPSQVKDIIADSIRIADKAQLFDAIVEKVVGMKLNPSFTMFESCFDSGKLKFVPLDNSGMGQILDGKNKIVYQPANKQVILTTPAPSRVASRKLQDFRDVPVPDQEYLVTNRDGMGRLHLRQGSSALLVDEATGVVYRHTRSSKNGDIKGDVFQEFYVTYPNGIIFPSLSISVIYTSSKTLYWISMSLIEEADFNVELPRDSFSLATPAGTTIIDKRVVGRAEVFSNLPATTDVVELADARIGTTPGGGTFWSNRSFQLVVSGLIILVVLAVLFFRKRAR
jgi:hypothetical protein